MVGTDQNSAINYELENNAGTAKLVSSSDSNDELKFSSLEEIINEHEISRDQIGLIKIDTDGFDFKIILSNKKLIKEVRPVLFFEYDITFADEGEQEAGELLEFLVEIDYNFLVYDNFGNILYDLDIVNSFFFYNINRYIRSCRASGGGIFYLDVLAIPKEFKIIKAEILQFENRTGGHYAI